MLLIAAFCTFLSAALQTALFYVIAMVALAMLASARPEIAINLWFAQFQVPIMGMIGIAAALVISILLLAVPLSYLQAKLCARAVVRARRAIIQAFLNTSAAYRSQKREGFLQQLVGEYTQHLSSTVHNFTGMCVAAASLATLMLIPLVISPKSALASFGAVAVCFLLVGPLSEWMRRWSLDRSEINREMSSKASQMARLADEITAFHVEAQVTRQLDTRIDDSAAALLHLRFTDALLPILFQFGTFAIVILLIAVLQFVDPGHHPDFAVLALLMFRLIGYARQLLGAIQNGSKVAPYVERIEAEVAALTQNARPQGSMHDVSFEGLNLRDVSFAYGNGRTVLESVSFDIPKGQAVGIVGASGGGKSSLCFILQGVRLPTSGTITTGGTSIHDIAPDRWWGMTAIVPQDTKLIAGSVADNIRFYREDHSMAEIVAAAKDAHIHDEIMNLPKGYDTLIGPGGRGFSGGQRQRLIIARALLGKPQFFILDEPSSALDRRSEALVAETLAALKGDVTIVIVSHRPAALSLCDTVWKLENGRMHRVELATDAA